MLWHFHHSKLLNDLNIQIKHEFHIHIITRTFSLFFNFVVRLLLFSWTTEALKIASFPVAAHSYFLLFMSLPLAFCDEEVISKKHEEQEQEVRQEMYSEQRKEMMNKQVTSLHQSRQEHHFESNVTEVSEWQQKAMKEKNYSEFTEHSQFSMVRLYFK